MCFITIIVAFIFLCVSCLTEIGMKLLFFCPWMEFNTEELELPAITTDSLSEALFVTGLWSRCSAFPSNEILFFLWITHLYRIKSIISFIYGALCVRIFQYFNINSSRIFSIIVWWTWYLSITMQFMLVLEQIVNRVTRWVVHPCPEGQIPSYAWVLFYCLGIL